MMRWSPLLQDVFGESCGGDGALELVKECTLYCAVVRGTLEGQSCTVCSSVSSLGAKAAYGMDIADADRLS